MLFSVVAFAKPSQAKKMPVGSKRYENAIIQNLMKEYAEVTGQEIPYEVVKTNINNLRQWGMPEEKLLYLTIEEVRGFLNNLSNRSSSQIVLSAYQGAEPSKVNENNPERIAEISRIKIIAKSKGISLEEFNSLIHIGYDIDAIEEMSVEEIFNIINR